MDKVFEELHREFDDSGFKSSIIPIQCLSDLRFDLENLLGQGLLCRDFYDEIISRYGLHWNFEPPADLPGAESIVIVAAPQPKVSVSFKFSGRTYSAVIPPTYIHDSDEKAWDIVSLHSGNHGYGVCNAMLPEKLLAVHCGLAAYGRNNVTYTDDWGSFFRLKTFFSDIPCRSDNWQEVTMMECCHKCTACMNKCPTGAICEDRFLIRAEHCLTFFNEKSGDFPAWIEPVWHNCLIGCMVCQDVCPANKGITRWVVPGGEFSEEETQMILEGFPMTKLHGVTTEKLKKLYMLDDYDLLQRNLRVLMEKNGKEGRKLKGEYTKGKINGLD